MAAEFKARMGLQYVPIYEVPPAIAVNAGPNLLSVSFFVDE
jgi:hypothetical protein